MNLSSFLLSSLCNCSFYVLASARKNIVFSTVVLLLVNLLVHHGVCLQ